MVHTFCTISKASSIVHRRKGSIKAKKWRSIFNLGRSSNDSKRKLNKPEEKGNGIQWLCVSMCEIKDCGTCSCRLRVPHLSANKS